MCFKLHLLGFTGMECHKALSVGWYTLLSFCGVNDVGRGDNINSLGLLFLAGKACNRVAVGAVAGACGWHRAARNGGKSESRTMVRLARALMFSNPVVYGGSCWSSSTSSKSSAMTALVKKEWCRQSFPT